MIVECVDYYYNTPWWPTKKLTLDMVKHHSGLFVPQDQSMQSGYKKLEKGDFCGIFDNQIILPCINVCTELPAENRFRLD